MHRAQTAPLPHAPASVTQVIADGVNAILARPGVIAIPIALDLVYALGRSVSVPGLADSLARPLSGGSSTLAARIDRAAEWVGGIDILGLAWFLIPSLLGGNQRSGMYQAVQPQDVAIGSPFLGLLTIAAVVFLVAVLYAHFGLWLADAALGTRRSVEERLAATPQVTLRILGLFGIIAVIAALVTLPVIIAWLATASAGADPGAFLWPMLAVILLGLMVLFYFAPEAIFVSDARPVQALRASVTVVRTSFSATLLFLAATTVLAWGSSELWQRLATNLPGLLLGMVASSATGCALGAAAMRFYRERIAQIERQRASTT